MSGGLAPEVAQCTVAGLQFLVPALVGGAPAVILAIATLLRVIKNTEHLDKVGAAVAEAAGK